MSEYPPEVQAFLQEYPCLQPTAGNKVRCILSGHEIPCRLSELRAYVGGKKYKRLSAGGSNFNYSQYEPHVVASTKEPNRLFCKLTLRHINRIPQHVLLHVSGKRYQRALKTYEECVRQGVPFVPVCLKQKTRKHVSEPEGGGKLWEPNSSEEDGDESEDSMSDLYPVEMFPQDNEMEVERDEFETHSESEAEASPGMQGDNIKMEVNGQTHCKRKKKQSNSLQKKFKSHHWKGKGFKKAEKMKT